MNEAVDIRDAHSNRRIAQMQDRTLEIDGGTVTLDGRHGAPLAFTHHTHPEISYLLSETSDAWHTPEHRWGSGFVLGTVAARWNAPTTTTELPDGSRTIHELGGGLLLSVDRHAATAFHERYVFTNAGLEQIEITGLGIVTPFRDVYDDAETSLSTSVHAHVWTGGRNAWVIAQPMSGDRPVLTLQLQEGALDAYSIESRNQFSSSNIRGHIVLHGNDAERSPGAFGGQRSHVLAPGEDLVLAWTVRWHETIDAARAAVRRHWEPDTLVASAGTAIVFPGIDRADVRVDGDVRVFDAPGGTGVTADAHSIVHVDVGDDRAALLFHAPVDPLVSARVRFILTHQRSVQRAGADADAFVPFDNRTGLTQLTSGWPDWSDGAERVGMAALVQQARLHGIVGDEVREALDGWGQFARRRLLDDTAAPRWGSDTIMSKPRLYNSPWIAHFFADQYRLYGRRDDLELAARILERSYELGAARHLSIGQPEAVLHVAALLSDHAQAERARELRRRLLETARHFRTLGARLPSHEVNYEQSMVAPLVTLYALCDTLSPSEFDEPLGTGIRWLKAFAGPQPHARMRHIGIRHWDGYWFGAERRWGDVFPHYWSVLSAVAWSQLPERFRTPELTQQASQIFRANLVGFRPDGTATAAFVLPSTVDGNAAYCDDPLANDQDWALALMLRYSRPPATSRRPADTRLRIPAV